MVTQKLLPSSLFVKSRKNQAESVYLFLSVNQQTRQTRFNLLIKLKSDHLLGSRKVAVSSDIAQGQVTVSTSDLRPIFQTFSRNFIIGGIIRIFGVSGSIKQRRQLNLNGSKVGATSPQLHHIDR